MTGIFWTRLSRFPPVLCRLLARKKGVGAISTNDLARAAKMSEFEIDRISRLTAWDEVPIAAFRAFTEACGVNLVSRDINKKQTYLKGRTEDGKRIPPSFRYLKRSPLWDSYYKPLIQIWRRAASRDGSSSS